MAVTGMTTGANTTIEDYLYGCVNFSIPPEGMNSVLLSRKIELGTLYSNMEEKDIKLCEAELYIWISKSPNRIGSVTDKDNDWEHSDGGMTLTSDDRSYFRSLANQIFSLYGEQPVGASKIRITSYGVKHCNFDLGMNPLCRKIE